MSSCRSSHKSRVIASRKGPSAQLVRAAAPHPNPLPVKNGEREHTDIAAPTFVQICTSNMLLLCAASTCAAHSAALAIFPNTRVGAGKPQEVPSVTLT